MAPCLFTNSTMIKTVFFNLIPQLHKSCTLYNVCKKTYQPTFIRKFNTLKRTFSVDVQRQDTVCNLNDAEIAEIVDGDVQLEKLLRVIILEVDVLRQDGHFVPEKITLNEWNELLLLKTRSARMRYLAFLFKNEKKKENKKRKTEERLREKEAVDQEAEESGHIKYGFGGNTIFLRVYDSTMDQLYNNNLINASLYSQHIVLDCSYEKYMSRMEQKNCAKQICMVFAENRTHKEPFHLQLCNADPNSNIIQCLHRYIPPMYEPHFPFFITEKSYLDMYPKEKIVYLTPHCKEDLTEWNHDDVYIIGGMVDKTNPKPLSLAKAKEEGLRMAKLPLERHLVWGSGSSKNLTLNQMISILLDVRHTGDWATAFRHIPRRKVIEKEDLINEVAADAKRQKIINKRLKTYGTKDILLSNNVIEKIKRKPRIDISGLYD